ncbi:hypothetical protein F2P81_019806 [Scophthalmus maximus]|uniref:Uncharacterized protein n=1 Tax=Scophthalmus maximus TaxID=52904 RepID=A0A6A4S492_SCOMX|nr:hypothetical protein F2P81_019806 [Scophthalmus maximus]
MCRVDQNPQGARVRTVRARWVRADTCWRAFHLHEKRAAAHRASAPPRAPEGAPCMDINPCAFKALSRDLSGHLLKQNQRSWSGENALCG